MAFRYQEGEILDHSLTSTNFHTYYQGSEMVVAGQLPGNPSSKILEYEITANQAGGKYVVSGSHNTTSMVRTIVICIRISIVLYILATSIHSILTTLFRNSRTQKQLQKQYLT